MRYLALDIGEKRVGIAVSDAEGRVALPLKVCSCAELQQYAPVVRRILEDYEPQALVCGLALSLDGERGKQACRIEEIAQAFSARCKLPLHFVDERLSSREAKSALHFLGLSEKDMRGRLDMYAASIILQRFLDQQTSGVSGDKES